MSPNRWRRLASIVVAVSAALSFASLVEAESKTSVLAEQVRKNADFRVRSTAALALGTSDDPAAVAPLCACLDDQSEVESVRVACAAGLGKLKKPGSDTCLKKHTDDSSSKIKEQVGSSIKALGGSVATASTAGAIDTCPSAPGAGTAKYYVGYSVTNKSTRPDGEIKAMVGKAFRCQLATLPRFKLTPSEADGDAKKMAAVVTKEKLDGYFLQIQVDPIKYDGGSLKVNLQLTIMTHTRDLKGTASKSLTMPDVTSPSKSDEDELLKTAATKLADLFAGAKS